MIGNPEETLKDVNETVELAKEIDPDYAVFNCTSAYPGTELYNNVVAENKLNDPKWYMHSTSAKEEKLMLSAEKGAWLKCSFNQEELISKAYRSFYFRPSFMLKSIVKVIKNPHFIFVILEAIPQIFRSK
jgi:radical SAM superfamily enzyme YgiQ (UPF0313 family)